MAAGESERKVEGGMRSPEMSEVASRGRDASVLPCTAATWSRSVVGEGAVSCGCDNRRRVPPSMKDACSDVARQSSAVLLGVNGGSGVSDRVMGIRLTDSE